MIIIYDPSTISAYGLPVYRRAVKQYPHLWGQLDAKTFCRALCRHAAVPTITAAEYVSIARVANGEIWPVPDTVYTREDWARDESFSAVPGQEVSQDIYDEMLNCMPPLPLPRCDRTRSFTAGFLMGEPHDTQPITDKTTYFAFGKIGNQCYYIGALPTR